MVSIVNEDLKHLLSAKKLVFGVDESLKLLRSGKLVKVLVSSNCDASVKTTIERLCVNGIEFVSLSENNDEIGVLCKKPFSISVVGVLA